MSDNNIKHLILYQFLTIDICCGVVTGVVSDDYNMTKRFIIII